MTIRLCEANPELQSTIIDFPNVAEIGWRFITEADLVNRVRYIPCDAISAAWPSDQDVILMSYLFSGVPGDAIPELIQRSFDRLAPTGTYLIHDFMVNQDGTGPELAALWQLQHMAFTPDAEPVSAGWLRAQLTAVGFENIEVSEMIPGMTSRPARSTRTVESPMYCAAPASSPTYTIRSPLMATASAHGFWSSTV